MGLTVEIVSQNTVKPSSPTPPCLRDYKLSHMDQLHRDIHCPTLLFYSNSTITTTTDATDHNRFKKALAETLTYMYPFAGRFKHDGMSIDCNDDGAEYIITRVKESMSTYAFIGQLLPLNLSSSWLCSSAGSRPPLVALQINHFSCGGVAVGTCIEHGIADASAIAAFLQMWEAISYGDNRMHVSDNVAGSSNFIFAGRTTLYPPLDNTVEGFDYYSQEDNSSSKSDQVSKLLVFDGPKIAALKEKVGLKQNPTRVHAMMAFICVH